MMRPWMLALLPLVACGDGLMNVEEIDFGQVCIDPTSADTITVEAAYICISSSYQDVVFSCDVTDEGGGALTIGTKLTYRVGQDQTDDCGSITASCELSGLSGTYEVDFAGDSVSVTLGEGDVACLPPGSTEDPFGG